MARKLQFIPRHVLWLTLVTIVAIRLFLFDSQPRTSIASVAITAGESAVVTELPVAITKSGSYTLVDHLSTRTQGIIIAVDNVILDLKGFSLTGSSENHFDGIRIEGARNVTIRNGTVKSFGGDGIHESGYEGGGHNHRLTDLLITGNAGSGIYLKGQGHQVHNCMAVQNSKEGIYLLESCSAVGNILEGNRKRGLHAGADSIVERNIAQRNHSVGIFAGANCSLTGNTAVLNRNAGIFAMTGSTVRGNTAHHNGASGIFAGSGCTVFQNISWSNKDHGVDVDDGVTLIGNTVYENEGHGISGGNNITLSANTLRTNHKNGIRVGHTATITGNTLQANQRTGLEAGNGCGIQGNTISGNNVTDSEDYAGMMVAADCLVKGNTLRDNLQYSIFVRQSGNAIEENLITHSRFGVFFNAKGNFYANNRATGITEAGYSGELPTGQGDGGGNAQF